MTYTIEELEQMMREYEGNLDLRYSSVTSLPNELKVPGDLYLEGTSITTLPEDLIVGGGLYIQKTQIASLPDNLTVQGSLILYKTPITKLPNNLTVGGRLDLRCAKITSLPDNLTVGGSLYLEGTPITSLPKNLVVGGDISLKHARITSLPDNLVVGGGLYLNWTPITSLPDNLTVGGPLELRLTQITLLPDELKIGGMLYLDYKQIKNPGCYRNLKNGDYEAGEYLFADRVLTHVKRDKKIDGYTFYIGKIPGRHVLFDGKYYSRCKSFCDGVRDIEFKRVADKGAEQYSPLTPDSEVSRDEAIIMYRVITGASQRKTETFVDVLGTTKDKYTVREIISITQGQYGSRTFAEFFGREN